MSLTVEKLDGNMAKLTIEVGTDEFEKALTKAYNKIKNQVQIPGFRKGKAPQKIVEKTYGVEVLYEDAANFMINDTYPVEAKECEYEIVSQPEIGVEQIERGKSFIYTATVAIRPEVTLGEYKGLTYTEFAVEVTDEDVQKELEAEQEKNSRTETVTDRAAAEGDTVKIDFDGYVDGNQFDGGKAEDYTLVLGSHSFIDTFEDQIAGHNVGDEFDVNVTFPESYATKELEGKPAVFKVKLNSIQAKILPELDDDFASEVSDFETFEEYKADLTKKIEERKTNEAKSKAKEELINQAVENAEMDIPQVMIDEQAKVAVQNMQMNMQQYGITLDQYLGMIGQTPEQFLESQKPNALKNIKARLVLEAIAKAEGIEASEEDLEKQYAEMADVYKMEVSRIKELMTDEEKQDLKADIAANNASELLFTNGKAVPAPVEEEKKEDAE